MFVAPGCSNQFQNVDFLVAEFAKTQIPVFPVRLHSRLNSCESSCRGGTLNDENMTIKDTTVFTWIWLIFGAIQRRRVLKLVGILRKSNPRVSKAPEIDNMPHIDVRKTADNNESVNQTEAISALHVRPTPFSLKRGRSASTG